MALTITCKFSVVTNEILEHGFSLSVFENFSDLKYKYNAMPDTYCLPG